MTQLSALNQEMPPADMRTEFVKSGCSSFSPQQLSIYGLVLSRSELLDRTRTPIDQATSDAVEETIGVLALSGSSLLDSTSEEIINEEMKEGTYYRAWAYI